ncbi:MAG: 1,4-dihydroxy-2-naphthoate octaprenyltransferase [Alloprevotella sp.]|nr:1,4-dihydroxy-2-naphthoate octaprenyltransferase [Alloprevotella sp.]
MQSLKYWFLAARPKTLSAAVAPVVVATALCWRDGAVRWSVAVWCALFAALMQIAANFINDLIDFQRGTDGEERLGPERACAQGWISPAAMRRGIVLCLLLAAAAGMAMLYASNVWVEVDAECSFTVHWERVIALFAVGLACIVFAFLYTTLLSYCGLGDLLVWLFFGFVPVLGTYYVQTATLTPEAWLLGAAVGLVTDTLLVLNNYRDRDTDRRSGKRTLVALLGARFGSGFYLVQGIAGYLCAAALACYGSPWCALLPIIYIGMHMKTWRDMVHINHGRALNRILGKTARNILVFGLLVALSLLL